MDFGRYGLPLDVKFCKKCTMSNQKPNSAREFKHKLDTKKDIIEFEDGICAACRFNETKAQINWEEREEELREVCNKYRSKDGNYDVIIPGSGGKDSFYAAHILKYKYNMNPITVTWPPHLYTSIGQHNFHTWLKSGFANHTIWPNQLVHRKLTSLAFKNLCHPFQPFMMGQMNLMPKIAAQLKIPFVVYGENPTEYGNDIKEGSKATKDNTYFTSSEDLLDMNIAGVSVKELMDEHKISLADLKIYLPDNSEEIVNNKIEVHYLGYYLKWHPQDIYYYSVENSEFKPNNFRTEGSYSRYSSIDDKIDWIHWYTYYAKFGIGRATADSAQEIRNGDITRDEGISLVKQYDGEYPKIYLDDCLDYLGLEKDQFNEIIDSFRPDHLWKKENNIWKLKKTIWNKNGTV